MNPRNPCGLRGIAFVELTGPDPDRLAALLKAFGFSRRRRHRSLAVDHYRQAGIHFLLNRQPGTFADDFRKAHGPSISSMGFLVHDQRKAFDAAVSLGARPYTGEGRTVPFPAIHGIGDSLIYFLDRFDDAFLDVLFPKVADPDVVPEKGFVAIDHLTNNVPKGTLQQWGSFYKDVFGFTEVRYFDIRGAKTGLVSYALRSPDGSFCIPINEGDEAKSQIEEYLREYGGPGIQHLAFLTDDLLGSLEQLDGSPIETLDIDDAYYDEAFARVPGVVEDKDAIRRRQVLVDGDDQGYLLQIFTKNLIGPIFVELIQRRNHASFGEGNFGALFRSLERDQEKRGVL